MRMARAFAAAAALVLAAFTGRSDAIGSPPTLYDYDYNGVTTYCYWIKQGLDVASFDYSYVQLEGKGAECPLLVTITQTTKGVLYANSDVEYQFTATLNFDNNKFGMTALEATVPDPTTRRAVQIGHANVHACSRTTVCDAFRDGANRRISNQETSNFTDDKATFTQKVNYAVPGDYNVFAHVVLPPKNARNETYQFVTFTTTTITSNEAATTSGSGTGTSTGVMVGVIVGAVVVLLAIVVGVIFVRRKRPADRMAPGNDHFRHSGGPGGYAQSNTTKSKVSRLDWNGDPEYQFGHDRYQASMVSEYSKQPSALNASALMFQDNGASRNKQHTVSSGGSSQRSGGTGSPRFRDQGRRTQPGLSMPDHGPYDPYFDNGALQSFTTETSMGTSNAYASDKNLYPPPHTNPSNPHRGYPTNSGGGGGNGPSTGAYPPFGLASGTSTFDDFAYTNGVAHDDDDDDVQSELSELERDSLASMGTIDFALPPPLPMNPSLDRLSDDSFCADDVPNLASTQLAFNDEEISKQTIEYIDSLRQQNYRDTGQASDYVSDFGESNRTYDFRESAESDQVYDASFRSSTDDQFTDTEFRQNKRTVSNDSESYEF